MKELILALLIVFTLLSFVGVIHSIIEMIKNHKQYINQLKQEDND